MIRVAVVVAACVLLVLMGCRRDAAASPDGGATRAPGPGQTAARMLALAEAGDWAAYVDDYYGETHKFRSDGDRRQLIERYETRWGGQVVALLRQAAAMEPQLSDDGAQAFFDFGNGQRFTLYREPDGSWKFHL
jgi:hypothetical protein